MAFGFYFDMTRCIGCRACQVACKDKNRLGVGALYRGVKSYTVGTFPDVKTYSYSASCNHCEDPICMKNCPVGAIEKAEDGTVIQDQEKGIRANGSQPACVAGCPNRALDFGDVDELRAKYGDDLNVGTIVVLPSPDETHPNVLIKAKDCSFDESAVELTW